MIKLENSAKQRFLQIQSFQFHQSKKIVLKFLTNIDINKITGTDMIGPRLLKLSSPSIADELPFICNHSISNSFSPSKWKEAKVAPLYKNGPLEEVNNYRPISILPVLS